MGFLLPLLDGVLVLSLEGLFMPLFDEILGLLSDGLSIPCLGRIGEPFLAVFVLSFLGVGDALSVRVRGGGAFWSCAVVGFVPDLLWLSAATFIGFDNFLGLSAVQKEATESYDRGARVLWARPDGEG